MRTSCTLGVERRRSPDVAGSHGSNATGAGAGSSDHGGLRRLRRRSDEHQPNANRVDTAAAATDPHVAHAAAPPAACAAAAAPYAAHCDADAAATGVSTRLADAV